MVASLAAERYISLTTFRRDGTPVSTPVWVVSDDGRRLLVSRGERIAAAARLVGVPGIDELLRRKYGRQKRLVDFLNRKSTPGAWIAIEIADP